MPEGGRLTIATANARQQIEAPRHRPGLRPGAYVTITVTDTGSGISGDVRAHVFEPFFTTKEQGKGTGLGLATVYGIVKQSGGGIYLDSEEGKGTRFTIYLPRVP
jgi:two-component system, cell cycle sensor histidine kinase and response regulator CckA